MDLLYSHEAYSDIIYLYCHSSYFIAVKLYALSTLVTKTIYEWNIIYHSLHCVRLNYVNFTDL